MPENLKQLPRAEAVLAMEKPLRAMGQFFVEVFSGDCIVTLAVLLSVVPCMLPWDVRFGTAFDVLLHGSILIQLARMGYLAWAHLGTPCQSQTWARSPQLRSALFPLGLPGLLEHQRKLVDLGNQLMWFSVELCLALYGAARYFSLENPELSWLWVQLAIQKLYKLPGVAFVKFLFRGLECLSTSPR